MHPHVAPLARGDRNEVQGCSPLKIVESMAAGTAVVASDLPVARELVTPGRDGLLVAPGAPRALARAMEAPGWRTSSGNDDARSSRTYGTTPCARAVRSACVRSATDPL